MSGIARQIEQMDAQISDLTAALAASEAARKAVEAERDVFMVSNAGLTNDVLELRDRIAALEEGLRGMIAAHPVCSHPIGCLGSLARRQYDQQRAAVIAARDALGPKDAAL